MAFQAAADAPLAFKPPAVAPPGISATSECGDGRAWTIAERVRAADLDLWKEEEVSGPGRDARVLPLLRDAQGDRHRGLASDRDAGASLSRLAFPRHDNHWRVAYGYPHQWGRVDIFP